MPNVRVRFTEPEYDRDDPPKPIPEPRIDLSQEVVRVQSEGFIVWEIESTDPRVERVRIEAEPMPSVGKDIPQKFFRTATQQSPPNSDTVREKTLQYTATPHPEDPDKKQWRGYGLIWGVAPRVERNRSVDKYAVHGYLKDGRVISRDPEIITDPPPIPGVEVPG